MLDQLAQREERLSEEQAALPVPDEAALQRLREEAQELEEALHEQRGQLADKEVTLPELEQALRSRVDALDSATQRLTVLEARIQALRQLQDRIARGAELEGWLAARELDSAPRLWQGMTIEPGWEDALEAVLRERLNGIALEHIERAAEWLTDQPPGKMTVVDAGGASPQIASATMPGVEPLQRYVTCRDARIEPVLREWLHDVYVLPDGAAGLGLRSQRSAGRRHARHARRPYLHAAQRELSCA